MSGALAWSPRPDDTLGWTRKALSPGAVKSHLIVHKKKIAQVRMATKIQSDQIQNLQQLDAVVAGPNDAKRLFVIDGQSHSDLTSLIKTISLYQTTKYLLLC